MSDPTNGPLPLHQIHDAVVFKAVRGGFLDPLRHFFKDMELEWSDCKTARAFRRNKKPIIQLGRAFITKEALNESEVADVIFHELMHHAQRHLDMMQQLEERGYSHEVQNVAMDAINNSTLHNVGCGGFFERYYKDENEFAFLRPNSKEFRVKSRFLRRMLPVRDHNRGKAAEFYNFYRRLYALEVTLAETLDFVARHFPRPSGNQSLLGEHADSDNSKKSDKEQQEQEQKEGEQRENEERENEKNGSSDKEPPPDAEKREQANPGGKPKSETDKKDADDSPLFDESEAAQIREALRIPGQAVKRKTSDNFAEIIRKVATVLVRDGAVRAEQRYTRRLPAKLDRHDVITLERDKNLFRRADYRLKEVTLFPDISGSMSAYIPFMIGLVQKLRKAELQVRVVCWASRPVEIPFTDLLQGKLPSSAGSGTDGELLAQFIQREGIEQAVIITDNEAGNITTRITGGVHLCLIEGARKTGSFLDKSMVPHCTTHQLKLAH
ncbi:MAG TPA: hypothetical protein V6C81_26790 [Planktothrix sp.]|jgi:hypothetical protein